MKKNPLLTSAMFFRLLRRRTRANASRTDRLIERRALRQKAILVCDASGFTRKTQRHGITAFLGMMVRCYDRLVPLIAKHGGACLSRNADNLLAVFDDPTDAVRAAIDVQRKLRQRNRGRREPDRFNICIGIHYGPVFLLADTVYGDTVNVAAKIGEDLAGRDDILVTQAVAEPCGSRPRCAYDRSTAFGGKMFELYRVRY